MTRTAMSKTKHLIAWSTGGDNGMIPVTIVIMTEGNATEEVGVVVNDCIKKLDSIGFPGATAQISSGDMQTRIQLRIPGSIFSVAQKVMGLDQ